MVGSVRAALTIFNTGVGAAVSERDVIEVTGADAGEYLHGQLSQDVTGLAIGASAMTLLLQPQGKVDAWMRLSRLADETFWLDLDPGFGTAAMERLLRFKLRVKCELELSTRVITAVRGNAAGDNLDNLGVAVPDECVVLPALWPGTEGFDVFTPIGSWLGEGAAEVATEALDSLRIRLGIPAMGRELNESTIPAAAGIVDRSVDFTKGCYVGQELVARIDSRGSATPTRLCGAIIDGGAALDAGSVVAVGEDQVGTVTSVAVGDDGEPTRALLYLKRGVTLPADAAITDSAGTSVSAKLVELPFP